MNFRKDLEEIAYSTLLGNREDLSFKNVSPDEQSVIAQRFISYLFFAQAEPASLKPLNCDHQNCHSEYTSLFRGIGYVVKSVPFSISDHQILNGQVLIFFSSTDGSPYILYDIDGLKRRALDCKTGKYFNPDEITAENLSNQALLIVPATISNNVNVSDLLSFGFSRLGLNFVILALCLILAAVFGLAYPLILSTLIQTVIPQGLKLQLWQLSGLFVVFTIAFIISEFASIFVFIFIDTVLDVRLQVATYKRLFSLPLSFFECYRSGDLMSRAQSITQMRAVLSGSFVDTVVHSSTIITSLIVFLLLDWKLTILVIVITIIYFLGTGLFGYYEANYKVKFLRVQGMNIGYLFNIIKSFTSLNSENRITSLLSQYNFQLFSQLKYSFKTDLFKSFADILDITLKSLGLFLLFYFGHIILVNSKPTDFLGGFTAGKFIAFISIYSAYITSIYKLTRSISTNGSTSISLWSRATPIFSTSSESLSDSLKLSENINTIKLNNILFGFNSQDKYLFQNLSCTFSSGDIVGISGDVASGKTAFIDLLLGFNTPFSGNVIINDINLASLNHEAYRSKIGVITQNREIIPGFLKDFLLNGGQFTVKNVESTLQKLGSYEEYSKYPLGLNTPLAYNGYNFTSSFRESLLLTRALIKPVDIFIADDSLLSSNSSIISAIQSFNENIIIIICTNRRDILSECSKRLYFKLLENGVTQVKSRS